MQFAKIFQFSRQGAPIPAHPGLAPPRVAPPPAPLPLVEEAHPLPTEDVPTPVDTENAGDITEQSQLTDLDVPPSEAYEPPHEEQEAEVIPEEAMPSEILPPTEAAPPALAPGIEVEQKPAAKAENLPSARQLKKEAKAAAKKKMPAKPLPLVAPVPVQPSPQGVVQPALPTVLPSPPTVPEHTTSPVKAALPKELVVSPSPSPAIRPPTAFMPPPPGVSVPIPESVANPPPMAVQAPTPSPQAAPPPLVNTPYKYHDDHFATMSRISGYLARYNCVILCSADTMYSAAYLSEVARFMAASLASYALSPPSSSMRRWLEGHCPVPYTPQIEISIGQAFNYFHKALTICHTPEGDNLLKNLSQLRADMQNSNLGRFLIPLT